MGQALGVGRFTGIPPRGPPNDDKFNRNAGTSEYDMITSTLLHGVFVWRPAIGIWIKSMGLALAVIALAGCESSGTIAAAKISRTPVIPQDDYRIGAGDSLK